jgi:hypothetical protein
MQPRRAGCARRQASRCACVRPMHGRGRSLPAVRQPSADAETLQIVVLLPGAVMPPLAAAARRMCKAHAVRQAAALVRCPRTAVAAHCPRCQPCAAVLARPRSASDFGGRLGNPHFFYHSRKNHKWVFTTHSGRKRFPGITIFRHHFT